MSGGNGQTPTGGEHVAVKADKGMVIFLLPKPVNYWELDPQSAFNFAEFTARAAHEARFGSPPPDGSDRSYLAGQVRARLTDEMHARMVNRATIMMNRLIQHKTTPAKAAQDIVDAIFAEVDRKDARAQQVMG